MNDPILRVNSLNITVKNKKKKMQILRNVSFDLRGNQALGIAGRSGAGKSMTMYALTGLVSPVAMDMTGSVSYYDGENVLDMREKQRRVYCAKNTAIIFQDSMNALNPHEKIYKQLEETILFHSGITKTNASNRIGELMDMVGIKYDKSTLNKYPHQFSGGMRQRIAIVLALETNAKILIADEPTTALDSVNQLKTVEFIQNVCRRKNLSLVFISHNLGLIAKLCSDVIVMENGEIVDSGPVDSVFASPASSHTLELVNGAKKLFGGYGHW
jgi:ABC-type dipeptide/oligopeptide/nickel transport system ATPase component